ncbi:MAG: DUF1573 domain-containing protein [Bacteroidales bacterium]|nr:DUF1573 domain-containing protein [Bacteroidales bacterium]
MNRLGKISMIVAVCLAWTMSMAGQTPRLLRFDEPVAEIGTIRHDAGKVNVRFTFENISGSNVSIVDVRTQCGCASPSFSREGIPPGGKGHIDVLLDPENLFAEQKRHLTVVASNGEYRKFSTITVHGYVDRGVSEEEVRYPHELLPGLRSEVETLGMRLNRRGEISEKSFSIYNSTDVPVSLKWGADDYGITAEMPGSVAPHSSAKVTVRLDTGKLDKGQFMKKLFIFADGRKAALSLKGAIE